MSSLVIVAASVSLNAWELEELSPLNLSVFRPKSYLVESSGGIVACCNGKDNRAVFKTYETAFTFQHCYR